MKNDISKFKDIHKDRRCFIMGTGYSLNYQDMNLLKNDITIGCNRIGLKYTPTYLCVSDALMYKNHKEEIDKINSPLFMTTTDEYPITEKNSKRSTYIIRCRKDRGLIWKGNFWHPDLEYITWWGKNCSGTVIIDLCIPLADFMGFKEIYLIGVDFTLIRMIKNYESIAGHFYDKLPYWQYQPVDDSEQRIMALELIKKKFENDGKKIYNATYKGLLEVFERVNYETLF